MAFGRRTTAPPPLFASLDVKRPPHAQRGGYWLGLLTVPVVLALACLVAGAFTPRPDLREIVSLLPAVAMSTTSLAAVILLIVDVVLRVAGLRNALVYALACGVLLTALTFVVSMQPLYRMVLAFVPGFSGGLVLGWFRR